MEIKNQVLLNQGAAFFCWCTNFFRVIGMMLEACSPGVSIWKS